MLKTIKSQKNQPIVVYYIAICRINHGYKTQLSPYQRETITRLKCGKNKKYPSGAIRPTKKPTHFHGQAFQKKTRHK